MASRSFELTQFPIVGLSIPFSKRKHSARQFNRVKGRDRSPFDISYCNIRSNGDLTTEENSDFRKNSNAKARGKPWWARADPLDSYHRVGQTNVRCNSFFARLLTNHFWTLQVRTCWIVNTFGCSALPPISSTIPCPSATDLNHADGLRGRITEFWLSSRLFVSYQSDTEFFL